MIERTKKGFSLIEVMLLFTVLAVLMAASMPVITKKSQAIPTKVAHGVYRCVYDPTANNGSGGLREYLYTATRTIKNGELVSRCSFNVPGASMYKVDMYSAGAGGTKYAKLTAAQDDNRTANYDMATGLNSAMSSASGSQSDPLRAPTEDELIMFDGLSLTRSVYTGDAGKGGNVTLEYSSPHTAQCHGYTDLLKKAQEKYDKLKGDCEKLNKEYTELYEKYKNLLKNLEDKKKALEDAKKKLANLQSLNNVNIEDLKAKMHEAYNAWNCYQIYKDSAFGRDYHDVIFKDTSDAVFAICYGCRNTSSELKQVCSKMDAELERFKNTSYYSGYDSYYSGRFKIPVYCALTQRPMSNLVSSGYYVDDRTADEKKQKLCKGYYGVWRACGTANVCDNTVISTLRPEMLKIYKDKHSLYETYADMYRNYTATQSSISALNKTINSLTSEINSLNDQINKITQQLYDLQKSMREKGCKGYSAAECGTAKTGMSDCKSTFSAEKMTSVTYINNIDNFATIADALAQIQKGDLSKKAAELYSTSDMFDSDRQNKNKNVTGYVEKQLNDFCNSVFPNYTPKGYYINENEKNKIENTGKNGGKGTWIQATIPIRYVPNSLNNRLRSKYLKNLVTPGNREGLYVMTCKKIDSNGKGTECTQDTIKNGENGRSLNIDFKNAANRKDVGTTEPAEVKDSSPKFIRYGKGSSFQKISNPQEYFKGEEYNNLFIFKNTMNLLSEQDFSNLGSAHGTLIAINSTVETRDNDDFNEYCIQNPDACRSDGGGGGSSSSSNIGGSNSSTYTPKYSCLHGPVGTVNDAHKMFEADHPSCKNNAVITTYMQEIHCGGCASGEKLSADGCDCIANSAPVTPKPTPEPTGACGDYNGCSYSNNGVCSSCKAGYILIDGCCLKSCGGSSNGYEKVYKDGVCKCYRVVGSSSRFYNINKIGTCGPECNPFYSNEQVPISWNEKIRKCTCDEYRWPGYVTGTKEPKTGYVDGVYGTWCLKTPTSSPTTPSNPTPTNPTPTNPTPPNPPNPNPPEPESPEHFIVTLTSNGKEPSGYAAFHIPDITYSPTSGPRQSYESIITPIITLAQGGDRGYIKVNYRYKASLAVSPFSLISATDYTNKGQSFNTNYAFTHEKNSPKEGAGVSIKSKTITGRLGNVVLDKVTDNKQNNIEPRMKLVSNLWTKQFELGKSGTAGKHENFVVTNLGTNCTFNVPAGGPILNFMKEGVTNYNKDNLEKGLAVSMTCTRGDDVVFQKSLDGGKYDTTIYTPAKFWWYKGVPASIRYADTNTVAKIKWKPTSLWAKAYNMFMGGKNNYDLNSFGTSQAGQGTVLTDNCTNPKGSFRRYMVYVTNGVEGSPISGRESTIEDARGEYNGMACYPNGSKRLYDNDPLIRGGAYNVEATPGGGGAIVITW